MSDSFEKSRGTGEMDCSIKCLLHKHFQLNCVPRTHRKKTKQSLGVTRVRELTLLFTSYSTWESRPCNLPGQLTRTEPVVRVSGEQALSKTTGELTPINTLYFPYSNTHQHLIFTLQQMGKRALHLALVI